MPVPSTRIHFRVEVRIKNGGQAGCIRALFPSMEKISRLSLLRRQLAATTPLSPALRGGHTQTLLGHILPSLSRQEFALSKAHTLPLSDGDKLIGHIGPGSPAGRGAGIRRSRACGEPPRPPPCSRAPRGRPRRGGTRARATRAPPCAWSG